MKVGVTSAIAIATSFLLVSYINLCECVSLGAKNCSKETGPSRVPCAMPPFSFRRKTPSQPENQQPRSYPLGPPSSVEPFNYGNAGQTSKDNQKTTPFGQHAVLPGAEFRRRWEKLLLQEQDRICDSLELVELYHRSLIEQEISDRSEASVQAVKNLMSNLLENLTPPLPSQQEMFEKELLNAKNFYDFEIIKKNKNLVKDFIKEEYTNLFAPDQQSATAPTTESILSSIKNISNNTEIMENQLFKPYSGWYSKNHIFYQDSWLRSSNGGGGGRTRVMAKHNLSIDYKGKKIDVGVFEKGGVNVSIVYGRLPKKAALNMNLKFRGSTMKGRNPQKTSESIDNEGFYKFYAAGLSLVLHPSNPMCPTAHANFRYFQVFDEDDNIVGEYTSSSSSSSNKGGINNIYDENDSNRSLTWWFGGGADLTPAYLFDADAVFFHSIYKKACDSSHPYYFPRFKRWCDNYFVNHHRKPPDSFNIKNLIRKHTVIGERRGIGGIFFDDLNDITMPRIDKDEPPTDKDAEKLFSFCKMNLQSFATSYFPLVIKRMFTPYNSSQKRWQQIRRGRYAEFNLLHDRGTKFGLQTPNARIDSIMMSLPLTSSWEYSNDHSLQTLTNNKSLTGKPSLLREKNWEDKLMNVLHDPNDWVEINSEVNKAALNEWEPPREV